MLIKQDSKALNIKILLKIIYAICENQSLIVLTYRTLVRYYLGNANIFYIDIDDNIDINILCWSNINKFTVNRLGYEA